MDKMPLGQVSPRAHAANQHLSPDSPGTKKKYHSSDSDSDRTSISLSSRVTVDRTPGRDSPPHVTAGDVSQTSSARQIAQRAAHSGVTSYEHNEQPKRLTTAQRMQAEYNRTHNLSPYQYPGSAAGASLPGHGSDTPSARSQGSPGSQNSVGHLRRLSEKSSHAGFSSPDSGYRARSFTPSVIQAKAEARVKKYSKTKDRKVSSTKKRRRHSFPFCCCHRREEKKAQTAARKLEKEGLLAKSPAPHNQSADAPYYTGNNLRI
jgi:hypothetical protein